MLTFPEKILFALAACASLIAALQVVKRISKNIGQGQGNPDWRLAARRLVTVLPRVASLQPVFRFRFLPSFFHSLIAWGFLYFVLVNLGDLLEAYIPDYQFLGEGLIGNWYRLMADLFSVGILVGMMAMILRRFLFKTPDLTTRPEVLLHPRARNGIRRDSAIVGGFILIHVGARLLGQSFLLAQEGVDPWRPFASIISNLWSGLSESALIIGEHLCFWASLGAILLFIPYFLYTKHVHLFVTPLNFLFKPNRRSIGELSRLNFEDETIEQFGAIHLEELGWEQLMDAYACIMCFRCQQVCPAYNTGKVLSPAALEINKRYFLNYPNLGGSNIAANSKSLDHTTSPTLMEFAIPEEAIWACTTCGACVEICPDNNEPMRDILDIRRSLVLMENNFPDQLQTAFRGMERTANPWNISPTERMKWTEGLEVPTIEEQPQPELLWWVGCAPATDARAQKTSRAFARILNASGVKYAVLGEKEQCTGDSARRAGNEFLFNELATANVELLNQIAPSRIVTTCPHCLHTLRNEYPAFGGHYQVIHHTQLINELISSGKLNLKQLTGISQEPSGTNPQDSKITFHDPCYLGRHNRVLADPRQALGSITTQFVEMPNHGLRSFCCGAGGAQMWKEEEEGQERVSAKRFQEAQSTTATTLAVSCPFCLIMLTDAQKAVGSEMQVLDVAEIIAEAIDSRA